MKIWLCASEFGDFAGGIATFHNILAAKLADAGHEVTVFVSDLDPDLVNTDAPYRVVPVHVVGGPLGYAAAASYCMWEALQSHRELLGSPDVIEFQDYQALGYFTVLGRWTTGEFRDVPIVVGIHGPKGVISELEREPLFLLPDFHTRWMESWTIGAADAVVAASNSVLGRLADIGVLRDAPTVVIPHPIPDRAPARHVSAARDIDVVYVGRLQLSKGIDRLSATLRDVWSQRPETTVAVIGSDSRLLPKGEMASDHLRRVHRSQVEDGRLQLLGRLDHRQVYQYLARSRIGVVPSRFEAFGYSAVEVLESGCLLALSVQAGVAEYLGDDDRVEIVDFDCAETSAVQVLGLIARPHSQGQEAGRLPEILTTAVSSRISLYRSLSVTRPSRSRQFPSLDEPQALARRIGAEGRADDVLLSVAVPYFRLPETITETIESLSVSDLVPDEVLIVDDGSEDDESEDVLASLMEREWPFHFRIHRQDNRGLAETRNVASALVRGKYLLFLDADDCVGPAYLSTAVDILERFDNVHYVGCWLTYVDDDGPFGCWPTWNPTLPYALVKNPINTAGLVFRRDSFIARGLNSPDLLGGMEDYDALLSLLEAGYRGVSIPREMFLYKVRPDSMSRSLTEEGSAWLYELLARRHRPMYSLWAAEVAALVSQNGRGWAWDNPTWPTPTAMGNLPSSAPAPEAHPVFADDPIPQEMRLMMRRLWSRRWVRTSVAGLDIARRVRNRVRRADPGEDAPTDAATM